MTFCVSTRGRRGTVGRMPDSLRETINLIAAIGVGGVPSNSLDVGVNEECIGHL